VMQTSVQTRLYVAFEVAAAGAAAFHPGFLNRES